MSVRIVANERTAKVSACGTAAKGQARIRAAIRATELVAWEERVAAEPLSHWLARARAGGSRTAFALAGESRGSARQPVSSDVSSL
jgi:hypothetical protein